jgi:hypothetical protein
MAEIPRTEYRVGWRSSNEATHFSAPTADQDQARRALKDSRGHPFRVDPWMQVRVVIVQETEWEDIADD